MNESILASGRAQNENTNENERQNQLTWQRAEGRAAEGDVPGTSTVSRLPVR
jgi:hypothetical protein